VQILKNSNLNQRLADNEFNNGKREPGHGNLVEKKEEMFPLFLRITRDFKTFSSIFAHQSKYRRPNEFFYVFCFCITAKTSQKERKKERNFGTIPSLSCHCYLQSNSTKLEFSLLDRDDSPFSFLAPG